ncbi:MAG TPA: acyl-CoA dehydrogenase family protein [Micromonosporaceae bacterium]|jgi:alkylation response protein AidB-like acyl-CoA dehydrogenase
MTDLLYTDVEDELRASVRSLLADRSPAASVRARTESDQTYDLALWRTLAVDLGLAGLLVPESLGGAGASYREAAVVLEEIGRAAAPVPFLGSAVVATTALLRSNAAAARELLGRLASGDAIAALAVPATAGPTTALTHTVKVDGDRLSGTVTSVADALPADVLLIPTDAGLYAVTDVSVSAVISLDMTRQLADVTLDGAAGTLVGDASSVAAALLAGAALLASEQLGLAAWCLEETVDYLKNRYQFGRQVGSFQALKHRLADIWVDVTQARATARYAADCAAVGDADLPVAVAVAQAFNGPMAVRTAEDCLQLHGGIGFTWEHPIHLYLKRAKADSIAFGTAAAYRNELGTLVDIEV